MSIGIYVFLRIYFLGFGVSDFAQFRTLAQSPAVRSLPDLYSVRGLLWAVCLASGTACAAACAAQSVRVRCGLGSPPEGHTGSAGGGVGHARDKIFQRKRRFSGFLSSIPPILTKRNACHCAIFQIFRKIQKDPSPGLICAILDRKKGAL